jgi:hypothetical protein
LDRWRLGELPQNERAVVAAHLAQCVACSARISEESAAFVAWSDTDPGMLRRLLARANASRRRGALLRWGTTCSAVVAAAAAVLIAALPQVSQQIDERVQPVVAKANTAPHGLLRKGRTKTHLTVYREHQGDVTQLTDGEEVAPKDRLRFEVVAPYGSHVMIVGIESGGRHFTYYPVDGQERSAPHTSESVQLLDGATELDESSGNEVILLATCNHPFDLHGVVAGLRDDCETTEIKVNKATP